jgi:hypothetical protein
MATFSLAVRGPFSLAASTRFLEGFTPAVYTGAAGPLELAFPVEGGWPTAGVRVREHPRGVTGEILSPARPSSGAELLKLSQRWRPYRTWVTLLRAQLEDETGEISGRNT